MSIPTRGSVPLRLLLLTLAASTVCACGALRQNLKNQFVSYRGTWHCPQGKCTVPQMVRASKNHREGTVNITHAKLDPRAAMAFYPGAPVETFTATISCEGNSAPVPEDRLRPPGSHKLKGQSDSWVVIVDPSDYQFGKCSTYRVTTHSTWEGGKKKYDESAGIAVQ